MELTILISYDSRRQIFTLPASLNELKTEVYDKFGIDSSVKINLQYYNEAWEEYIDVSGDKEIIAGKKYMVLVDLPKVLYVEENSVTEANTSVNNSESTASVSVSENQPIFSFEPLISSTPHSSFCTDDIQIRIPEERFSDTLRQTLKDELPLFRCLRSEFIRTICSQVNLKYLPSVYVTDMARAIITNYPYLKEKIGTGYGGWRQSIRDWFKNMRRFDKSEEVQKMKKIKGHNEKHKETKLYENQIQEATQELEGSFSSRRAEILKNNMKVNELFNKYPKLFTKSAFSEEFFRVSGRSNLCECCSLYFANNGKALSGLLKRRKLLPSWVEALKSMLDESGASNEVIEEELIILTLPVHFCEEQLALVYPATKTIEDIEDSGTSSPHIVIIGRETKHPRYLVVPEQRVLIECKTLHDVISILMASYYILNCEYPKGVKNTLLFLENQVFKIQVEKKKIPSKIINFVEKLKNFVE